MFKNVFQAATEKLVGPTQFLDQVDFVRLLVWRVVAESVMYTLGCETARQECPFGKLRTQDRSSGF